MSLEAHKNFSGENKAALVKKLYTLYKNGRLLPPTCKIIKVNDNEYKTELDLNVLDESKFSEMLEYFVQVFEQNTATHIMLKGYESGWDCLSQNYMTMFGIAPLSQQMHLSYFFISNDEIDKIKKVTLKQLEYSKDKDIHLRALEIYEFCRGADHSKIIELIRYGFMGNPAELDSLKSIDTGDLALLNAVREFFEIYQKQFEGIFADDASDIRDKQILQNTIRDGEFTYPAKHFCKIDELLSLGMQMMRQDVMEHALKLYASYVFTSREMTDSLTKVLRKATTDAYAEFKNVLALQTAQTIAPWIKISFDVEILRECAPKLSEEGLLSSREFLIKHFMETNNSYMLEKLHGFMPLTEKELKWCYNENEVKKFWAFRSVIKKDYQQDSEFWTAYENGIVAWLRSANHIIREGKYSLSLEVNGKLYKDKEGDDNTFDFDAKNASTYTMSKQFARNAKTPMTIFLESALRGCSVNVEKCEIKYVFGNKFDSDYKHESDMSAAAFDPSADTHQPAADGNVSCMGQEGKVPAALTTDVGDFA